MQSLLSLSPGLEWLYPRRCSLAALAAFARWDGWDRLCSDTPNLCPGLSQAYHEDNMFNGQSPSLHELAGEAATHHWFQARRQ